MTSSDYKGETKAERQARERREAKNTTAPPVSDKQPRQGFSKQEELSPNIDRQYFYVSIRIWLSRIIFAVLICVGLYLFYAEYMILTIEKIENSY